MQTHHRRILVLDPQIAGVSGDMMVGALLDLGADATRVIEAMEAPRHSLPSCRSIKITVMDAIRREIRAKKVDVKVEEGVAEMTGAELREAASRCLQRVRISEEATRFALDSLNTLISAEAQIHGQSTQEVHLHETASADTLADVIGTAVALDDLKVFADTAIYSMPVALGGGLLRFSHGTVSSPAPATLEILRSKGFLTVGGPVEAELATPTGVSLLTSTATECTRWYPPMKPTRVGYGAGTRDFVEMPNVLRAILGEPLDLGLSIDQIYVIETNLDDATGELIGHAMNRLLQEGARDVSAIPMITKKGRPGYSVKIIADRSSLEHLCQILIGETGTLGARFYPCERRILARGSVPVDVVIGNVRETIYVKVARTTKGEIIQIKPEYDDIERLAAKTGRPLREIEELVKRRASDVLRER